jgi:hypothetical protein
MPGLVLLSTSLLTDRMLLYTELLQELSKYASITVWASSARNPGFRDVWAASGVAVEGLPEVYPFSEFPYNYLRRLNEFIWDFRQRPPSRLSIMRHIRDKKQKLRIRALRFPAWALAIMGAEKRFEDWLEKLLLSYQRSPAALERLRRNPPAFLLTTGPQRFDEPAIVAVAKNLGIPTIAFITSWDNLSTKGRMVFKYDGYLLWSEQAKRELHHFYPESRKVPAYVVGAPQFDVFFQTQFHQTREEFCILQRLNPKIPIILHALGSPNFLKEQHSALYLAERVARGDLGDVQLLVRPHPIHDRGTEAELLCGYGPRVIVQHTSDPCLAVNSRFQDENQIKEWVNTFRHADVVVNLSSTVAIDAAILDRPVVNLDYDPEPGRPNQALVEEVNHLWTHFKPVAESGGVWLVNSPEEMVDAVRTYLAHPELHREKRRWIAEYVCQHLDGGCGQRMAAAIVDFMKHNASKRVC